MRDQPWSGSLEALKRYQGEKPRPDRKPLPGEYRDNSEPHWRAGKES